MKTNNVSSYGEIYKVQIDGTVFVVDSETGSLKCKDPDLESFDISEGSCIRIEGAMQDGIKSKSVVARIPLNFKR